MTFKNEHFFSHMFHAQIVILVRPPTACAKYDVNELEPTKYDRNKNEPEHTPSQSNNQYRIYFSVARAFYFNEFFAAAPTTKWTAANQNNIGAVIFFIHFQPISTCSYVMMMGSR